MEDIMFKFRIRILDFEKLICSYGTKHVEDVVFKANAARDDAESWLCQIADGDL